MRVVATGDLSLEPQLAGHAADMFEVLSDSAIYEYENEPPSSPAWLTDRYTRLESRQSVADGPRDQVIQALQSGRIGRAS